MGHGHVQRRTRKARSYVRSVLAPFVAMPFVTNSDARSYYSSSALPWVRTSCGADGNNT